MSRAIKGQNCATTRAVIRELAGAARFDAMIATLPAPERELGTRRILPVEWVDFEAWNRIESAFFTQLFDGDAEAYANANKIVGERDFGTIYRALITLASPYGIIDRVASAWSKVFNFGALTVVASHKPATTDRPIVLRMSGVPANPSFVHGMRGGIQGVLGLTRAKAPLVVVAKIDARGDDSIVEYACSIE